MYIFKMQDAINTFMRMMIDTSKDEFIMLFEMAWYIKDKNLSPQTSSLYFNDEIISTRNITAKEMAEHLWEKWNYYHRDLMKWWMDLDSKNQERVSIMAEVFKEEH